MRFFKTFWGDSWYSNNEIFEQIAREILDAFPIGKANNEFPAIRSFGFSVFPSPRYRTATMLHVFFQGYGASSKMGIWRFPVKRVASLKLKVTELQMRRNPKGKHVSFN